jgi:hypothetical protein
MNKSLATWMSIAATMFVLSALVIGIAYYALQDTNTSYQDKMENFQTNTK